MKILILDAHSPAALAVTRSLSKKDVRVDIAGEEGQFNLTFYSKYPTDRVLYPSPANDINRFIAFFSELIQRSDYSFIFPITDRTIFPLHQNRAEWLGEGTLNLPDYNALEVAFDKEKTLRLAERLGVPVPHTHFFSREEDIDQALKNARFPLVVKSRYSKYITGDKLISDDGPRFGNSIEEVIKAWQAINNKFPGPLIQEMVQGDGYGIFLLMKAGQPLAIFAHHRLREEEPLGARSSFCESIDPPPEMERYAIRLLSELNWTGPAMVEFKLDERNGIPKLMEINGRFWGSLPLAIAAGVDFPYLYYQMLEEGERGKMGFVVQGFSPAASSSANIVQDFSKTLSKTLSQTLSGVEGSGAEGSPAASSSADVMQNFSAASCHYKIGLKARYLYADFQHLINVLRGKPAPWMTYPGKFKTIINFISSFRPGIKYFNLDLQDPLPGIIENARFLFSELPKRLWKKR